MKISSFCRFLIRFMLEMIRTRRAAFRLKDQLYNELACEFHRAISDGRTIAQSLLEKNTEVEVLQIELANARGLLSNKGAGAQLLAREVITLTAEIERLTQESLRDPLTGLLRRSVAEEKLIYPELHMLQRHAAEGKITPAVSIVMMDIDHFKRVNDTLGHAAGDDVLRRVAELTRSVFKRDTDHVIRYGGEEICVVAMNTTPHVAAIRSSLLRTVIENDAELSLACGQVTASFGISDVETSLRDVPAALDSARCRADGAMYLVKKNGRNDVAISLSSDSVG
ncbi:MAG: GGDEF domain-containing protein [Candidatus Moraniibacteriota bacterium]